MVPWGAPADLPVTVTFLILLFLLAMSPPCHMELSQGTEPGTHSSSCKIHSLWGSHCSNLEPCAHQKLFVRC